MAYCHNDEMSIHQLWLLSVSM